MFGQIQRYSNTNTLRQVKCHHNKENCQIQGFTTIPVERIKANFNGYETAQRDLQLYPNRRQPNHKLFRNLYNHLGETRYIPSKINHGTPKTLTVDEDGILIRVSENPGLSTRRLSATTGLS
ncbi:hypothetical protein NQ318_022801 [Aromia moschata]|uniref:Uncharacterized protein n=1 Tax=Aromia moschata TaxID=1265417 RepID=A0AAV8XIN3_9CUCU|nr:hypothetical protein NQ318_022801 [Aromia moschata]